MINRKLIDTGGGGGGLVPSEHFNTVLYNGNSTTNAISGVGFQPDFVWIKGRSGGSPMHNSNFDSVRGENWWLSSNLTNADDYNASFHLNSFDSDGFTMIGNSVVDNLSGVNYVAWCLKAGGNSNTYNIDGTGYATASAAGLDGGTINPIGASINTQAGISIIKYSATGSTVTYSHGLGVTPSFIITKGTTHVSSWDTWETMYVGAPYLNDTGTGSTTGSHHGTPNSTTIGASHVGTNATGSYITYAFAEIEGFSKFGTFIGNGTASTSNPIQNCGFEPAFVMMKNMSTAGTGWFMFDNKRSTTNPRERFTQAQSDGAEGVGSLGTDYLYFESNGFRSTSDSPSLNGSGDTILFMAFSG